MEHIKCYIVVFLLYIFLKICYNIYERRENMASVNLFTFDNIEIEKEILGPNNINIDLISEETNVKLNHISGAITVDEVVKNLNVDLYKTLQDIFKTIEEIIKKNNHLESRDLIHIIKLFMNSKDNEQTKEKIFNFYVNKRVILNTFEGKKIIAKTLSQKNYIETLDYASIIFVTGSAGTGKTYLAVAYAVNALKKNQIKKIIITRPVVEAGEKLGFLPGDLKEKVDPYLIPIYDALYEFMGKENVDKLIEKGVIEIAPLAYMRGRTLDNAMIILDEAQNTTSNQMKMFITRLGFNSKMVITGDVTQIDLPSHLMSGLIVATKILTNVSGIAHVKFEKYDVMRHPLVSKIIEKYEENNDKI